MLFDLEADPEQQQPLVDDDVELLMINTMLGLMHANDAPRDQYERLGFPISGEADESHLLIEKQLAQVEAARRPLPDPGDSRIAGPSVNSPLQDLHDDPTTRAVLNACLGDQAAELLAMVGESSLVRLASFTPLLSVEMLHRIDEELAAVA